MIKSKTPETCKEYGDRYCLLGPLSHKSASMEVEPAAPHTPAMAQALQSLQESGVHYLFGKWLVEGSPYVLLFDVNSVVHRLNEWKSDLWSIAGVPSPANDQEADQAIMFGYLVAWFLGNVVSPKPVLKSSRDFRITNRSRS